MFGPMMYNYDLPSLIVGLLSGWILSELFSSHNNECESSQRNRRPSDYEKRMTKRDFDIQRKVIDIFHELEDLTENVRDIQITLSNLEILNDEPDDDTSDSDHSELSIGDDGEVYQESSEESQETNPKSEDGPGEWDTMLEKLSSEEATPITYSPGFTMPTSGYRTNQDLLAKNGLTFTQGMTFSNDE